MGNQIYYALDKDSNQQAILIHEGENEIGLFNCPMEKKFHRYSSENINEFYEYMNNNQIRPIEISKDSAKRELNGLVKQISELESECVPDNIIKSLLNLVESK